MAGATGHTARPLGTDAQDGEALLFNLRQGQGAFGAALDAGGLAQVLPVLFAAGIHSTAAGSGGADIALLQAFNGSLLSRFPPLCDIACAIPCVVYHGRLQALKTRSAAMAWAGIVMTPLKLERPLAEPISCLIDLCRIEGSDYNAQAQPLFNRIKAGRIMPGPTGRRGL